MVRTIVQLEPYLQGWWPLNTDFKDHSQNTNHSAPTAITWKPTKRGFKPSFNGTTSLINCGNNASLRNSTFSISFWWNWHGNDKEGFGGLINKINGLIGSRILINDGTSQIIVQDDGVTQLTSNTVFEKYKWYHIILTFDGTFPRLYVNGILDIVGAVSTFGTGVLDFRIGIGSVAGNTYYSNAEFADVRFYNTLFTTAEVLFFYNAIAFSPGTIPAERSFTHQLGIGTEPGLVLGFDGHSKNTDGTFTDMSGNSNDGTNYGTSRDVSYFGEVRKFDGVNDYIDCENDNSLNFTEEITIEALIYKTGNVGAWNRIVTSSHDNPRYMMLIDDNNRFNYYINDNAGHEININTGAYEVVLN
ncbi:MAG: hypothetical protein E4G94_04660, partial [ANME-2 cluster archaeon]